MNPTGVSFLCTWENLTDVNPPQGFLYDANWPALPNTFAQLVQQAPGRLATVADRTSPKRGLVLAVEVQPGDSCGWGEGERAEAAYMLDANAQALPVTEANGHEQYVLSVCVDPTWNMPAKNTQTGMWTWGIFFQLHSPNQFSSPPAFALSLTNVFGVNLLGGDLMAAGVMRPAAQFPLTNAAVPLGQWVEFFIDVMWSYTNGHITVLRRDVGESKFVPVFSQTGPTLQFNSSVPDSQGPGFAHYWRCGYYRSTIGYVTSKLKIGPIARGVNPTAVLQSAL